MYVCNIPTHIYISPWKIHILSESHSSRRKKKIFLFPKKEGFSFPNENGKGKSLIFVENIYKNI